MRNRPRPSTKSSSHLIAGALCALCALCTGLVWADETPDESRFSDQPAPLRLDEVPSRPRPLIEWGNKFLGPGRIHKPITLPTGAVWDPSFWMYGNFRTAVQTYDDGTTRYSEWANRLDLFGNLQLAATERILVGIRPLDRNGRFTEYNFEPHSTRGWQEDFSENSLHVRTLFFEGEFGEMFPHLDHGDKVPLDIGISVGRQPLRLQDGLLVEDDSLDLLALTKNSILPKDGSTLRLSGLFAWNQIDRNNNVEDVPAYFFGLDAAADYPSSTYTADLLYITSDQGGDGLYLGLGQTRRFGKINSTFRIVNSIALERASARVRDGTLLFSELSYTVPYADDIVYVNGFWGIDHFSSAIRAPTAGGPLGRIGLLFEAVGLGRYGSAVANTVDRSAGGALGYQMFFGELHRRQIVLEIGGRGSTDGSAPAAEAIGLRYQQAFGQRLVMVVDGFAGLRENSKEPVGGRLEFLVKF